MYLSVPRTVKQEWVSHDTWDYYWIGTLPYRTLSSRCLNCRKLTCCILLKLSVAHCCSELSPRLLDRFCSSYVIVHCLYLLCTALTLCTSGTNTFNKSVDVGRCLRNYHLLRLGIDVALLAVPRNRLKSRFRIYGYFVHVPYRSVARMVTSLLPSKPLDRPL